MVINKDNTFVLKDEVILYNVTFKVEGRPGKFKGYAVGHMIEIPQTHKPFKQIHFSKLKNYFFAHNGKRVDTSEIVKLDSSGRGWYI